MPILEEVRALLWQIPIPTRHAFPAAIGDGPGDPLTHEALVALFSKCHNLPHAFVSQHAWTWLQTATIRRVQVGSADCGERELYQHITRSALRQRHFGKLQRFFGLGEDCASSSFHGSPGETEGLHEAVGFDGFHNAFLDSKS